MTRPRAVLPLVLLLAALAPARAAVAAEDPREIQARAQYASGDYQKALNVFAALFAEKGDPLYLRNIGRCHQKLRQPDKAIDAFEEYLRKGRRLKAQEKAEIKGFIREMEALRAEQAKAPPVTAPPVGPQPPPVATAPPPTDSAGRGSAPARGSSGAPASVPGRSSSSASPPAPGRVAASARPAPLPMLPASSANPPAGVLTATKPPPPAPQPLTRQWWFWAGVGAVVVGGVVAVFALKGGGGPGSSGLPAEVFVPMRSRRRWAGCALACALAAAGCASGDQAEGLALFTVTVSPEVPTFSRLLFEAVARDLPAREVEGDPRPNTLSFGYYLPGAAGTVQVRGQALDAKRCVVGEGMVEATVRAGQVSAAVALLIEPTAEHDCLPPIDAAAEDDGPQSDGGIDAPARPDGGLNGDASSPDGACGAGLTSCGTACIPLTGCCVSAQCPLRANATRACDPETHACAYLCMNGHHECGDECVRDDAVETCGDRCVACDAPKGGFVTCNGAACVPACPSGQKICVGNCIPEQQACAGSCPGGTRVCPDNLCRAEDVKACGAACEPCDVPTHAVASCADGKCGFACPSPYKRCGGECIPEGSCCSPAECTAPANAAATCTSNACGFTCNDEFRPCGGGCLAKVACCTVADCTAPANAVPTCSQAGACGFTCTGQFQPCGDHCIPVGACCTAIDCPTPDNATATCTDGRCGFTCTGTFKACPTTCVAPGGCCVPADCPAPPAHAAATCSAAGMCETMCDPGFVRCEGGCRPALDLDANQVDDCTENLLRNGQFTTDVAGWGGELQWGNSDGKSAPDSGSARIVVSGLDTQAAAAQCVAVTPSTAYVLWDMFFLIPGAKCTPTVRITPFTDGACGAGAGAAQATEWPDLTTSQWHTRSASFVTPADAHSVRVELVAAKEALALGACNVLWDNIVLHP